MAPSNGRLTYQITVPTGGWETTVGAGTATIPAGTYHIDEFLDEVAEQFATAGATTCAVSASLGENGSGLSTITFGAAKAITWVDTEVRDILGFEGLSSSSATVHNSTLSCRGVWLPTCPYFTLNGGAGGSWRGHREAAFNAVSNMAGHVWAIAGPNRVVLDPLRWRAIKRERIWIDNETVGNQSLERFWLDTIAGEAGWATPGGPIRWYPDAADTGIFGTYRAIDWDIFRPDQLREGWVGLWQVTIPPLIQVPGTEATGLTVETNEDPVADFTFVTDSSTGLEVTFTDASTDADGTIVAWSWDFGDGYQSTLENPVHTYLAGGRYTVSLTVTDDDGATHSVSMAVPTVPMDGPNNWYRPTTAAQFGYLNLQAPTFLYLCQEASGDLAPAIGATSLLANGSPLYQQAVTDWDADFVGFTDGTAAQRFQTTTAAFDLVAGQSMAWLAYASVDVPAGIRRLIFANTTTDEIRILTSGLLRSIHNSVSVDGVVNHTGIDTVRQFVWYRNATANESGTETDLESITGTHDESAQATAHGIGAPGATAAPTARFCLVAVYTGAAAEQDWAAYLSTLRGE